MGMVSKAAKSTYPPSGCKINITDMLRTNLSLESLNSSVFMVSLTIGEMSKPPIGRFNLSEEALRSLSNAALAMANDLHDKKASAG